MTDETTDEILEAVADIEEAQGIGEAPVEVAFKLGLPESIVKKIDKTGQTRGAEDDTFWQNRVNRNSTVLIPLSDYEDFVYPDEPFEKGFIVLASPEHYFSNQPPLPKATLPRGLALGNNLLVVYETRQEWNTYNPDSYGWNYAISRTSPLGGQYIARVPGITSEGEDAKAIRLAFTGKDSGGKGAGIRFYEYASSEVVRLTKYQLAFLTWRTEGIFELSQEFLEKVAERITVTKEEAFNALISNPAWARIHIALQESTTKIIPGISGGLVETVLLAMDSIESHRGSQTAIEQLLNINTKQFSRGNKNPEEVNIKQSLKLLKKLINQANKKSMKLKLSLSPSEYKANLDARCQSLGLADIKQLQQIRAIDSKERTVCPLCLKPIDAIDLASRVEQAEGRYVPDLTITAANLFHIEELKKGVYNHRPYNLGWGHHHCNATARDIGVDDTLLWMDEVVNNPENKIHINQLKQAAQRNIL